MNSLLKLELKRKIQIKKIISAIIARAICLVILFSLVLLIRIANGILALFISLSVTILLFTPASIINSFISKSARREISELIFTKIKRSPIILYKLIVSNIYNIAIILIINIIIFIFLYDYQKMTPSGIIKANLVIFVIMIFSSALAIIIVSLLNRSLIASSFCAYLIISVLLFSVIIIGPFILITENQRAKDIMTKSALNVNPVIMLVRSVGKIDIMRTEYMYNVADPIVGRGFAYPDWRIQCLGYFVISCLFISVAIVSSSFFLRL